MDNMTHLRIFQHFYLVCIVLDLQINVIVLRLKRVRKLYLQETANLNGSLLNQRILRSKSKNISNISMNYICYNNSPNVFANHSQLGLKFKEDCIDCSTGVNGLVCRRLFR